jgi:hypothetical protein
MPPFVGWFVTENCRIPDAILEDIAEDFWNVSILGNMRQRLCMLVETLDLAEAEGRDRSVVRIRNERKSKHAA